MICRLFDYNSNHFSVAANLSDNQRFLEHLWLGSNWDLGYLARVESNIPSKKGRPRLLTVPSQPCQFLGMCVCSSFKLI
jgi:hypothetical protein